MPTSRDPRKVIDALLAKAADPTVTLDESVALTQKANELREKYNIPKSDAKPEEQVNDIPRNPFTRMTREEFIRFYFTTPNGVWVSPRPMYRENIFRNHQWLNNMTQENPQGNEETWEMIFPENPDY